MIPESDLIKFDFHLSDEQPIQVIHNTHLTMDDHWFDMHYPFEVGIILKGAMFREYLNDQRLLSQGDMWFCGMWEPHGFELHTVPCEVAVLVIDPGYLFNSPSAELLSPFQAPPSARPQICDELKHEVLDLGKKLIKKTGFAWQEVLFRELMLIVRDCQTAPLEQNVDGHEYVGILPALKMVHEKRQLITTEEAATACHLATAKFRATFKRLMECTFSDFALQYRIRGAMRALKHSDETHEVIAQEWGFTDASHLHRYLK